MKNRILALFACVVPFFFGPLGCHAQANPTPPQYTAPVAGNGAYTPLNPSGTSASTYTDSPSGQVGYVVQGYIPASGTTPAQYGQWSNVVGPVTGGSTGKVTLSWTCTAGSGQTCNVQWIVSRASAVTATAPATPAANAPTSSEVVYPIPLAREPQQASVNIPAVVLTASK